MIVNMRSNDLIKGYPNDVTEFQWIQEIIAGWLGLELGTYSHIVGSLHVYDSDLKVAGELIKYDKGYELYDKVRLLDARLNREDYDKVLTDLDDWETKTRVDPDRAAKILEDATVITLDYEFYVRLMNSIAAYNLNKAGYLEEAYHLVEDGKSDLEFIFRDKWKDVVE